jgi:hypothetical protein
MLKFFFRHFKDRQINFFLFSAIKNVVFNVFLLLKNQQKHGPGGYRAEQS